MLYFTIRASLSISKGGHSGADCPGGSVVKLLSPALLGKSLRGFEFEPGDLQYQ